MTIIKNTAIALATAAVMSTAAYAGSMEAPVMEPEIIVEETSAGTGEGWIVPLVLLALIAAVATAD